jgi:hypothetical protein
MTTSKRVAREAGKQPERPATPEKVKGTGAPAESGDKGWEEEEEEIILLILPEKRPVS